MADKIPKIYMPSYDEIREVTQDWVDEVNRNCKRQHNRNYLIKAISNLNITNEDDMALMLKIEGLFADRELKNAKEK